MYYKGSYILDFPEYLQHLEDNPKAFICNRHITGLVTNSTFLSGSSSHLRNVIAASSLSVSLLKAKSSSSVHSQLFTAFICRTWKSYKLNIFQWYYPHMSQYRNNTEHSCRGCKGYNRISCSEGF